MPTGGSGHGGWMHGGVMLTYGGAAGAQGVTWRCIQHGSEGSPPASRGVDTIAWPVVLTKMSQIRKSFCNQTFTDLLFWQIAATDRPKIQIGNHQPLLIWMKGGENMGSAALFKNPSTHIPESDFLIKSGPDWP